MNTDCKTLVSSVFIGQYENHTNLKDIFIFNIWKTVFTHSHSVFMDTDTVSLKHSKIPVRITSLKTSSFNNWDYF